MKKKVVIADDHPIVLRGLNQLISGYNGYQVAGQAADGHEVLTTLQALKPDILILDLSMPNLDGFDVMSRVSKRPEPPSIVVYTFHAIKSSLDRAISSGAMGYVLKTDSEDMLLTCLDTVAAGKRFITPAVSWKLLDQKAGLSADDGLSQLTAMERTVFKLIGELKTNREVAEALSLSIRTVEKHRNNICKKLGLSGRNALLRYTLEHTESV